MNVQVLRVGSQTISKTVKMLQGAGERECVVLWLAARVDQAPVVKEVYQPQQRASEDYFEIPRAGMAAVMERLRVQGLWVAAQIHTHPGRAFHSAADEKWAIVRHLGALSIVIPDFARHTVPEQFFDRSAVFRMDAQGRWAQIRAPDEVVAIE
jgi:proteasome lid subunit RPN8/RPN11